MSKRLWFRSAFALFVICVIAWGTAIWLQDDATARQLTREMGYIGFVCLIAGIWFAAIGADKQS
jgi:hypothetical protein